MRSWPEARLRAARAGVAPATLALALVAGACASAPAQGITVTEAWIRAPAGAAVPAAAYFTITNAGRAPDALVAVSSPAAEMSMLHQSTTDPDGLTGMVMVARLEVPAGATVRLEPGGYHVMLEGLAAGSTSGTTVELVLRFERAGTVRVQAEIRAG